MEKYNLTSSAFLFGMMCEYLYRVEISTIPLVLTVLI